MTIALVGKYTELHDAYLSVEESLFHAGTANDVIVDIRWVDSSKLTPENAASVLDGCAGILVPGGFGDRGIEGDVYKRQGQGDAELDRLLRGQRQDDGAGLDAAGGQPVQLVISARGNDSDVMQVFNKYRLRCV